MRGKTTSKPRYLWQKFLLPQLLSSPKQGNARWVMRPRDVQSAFPESEEPNKVNIQEKQKNVEQEISISRHGEPGSRTKDNNFARIHPGSLYRGFCLWDQMTRDPDTDSLDICTHLLLIPNRGQRSCSSPGSRIPR